MYITEITVHRAAKINIGNYENTDVGFSVTVCLREGDNADAIVTKLHDNVDNMLGEAIDSIEQGKRKAKSKSARFGV